MGLNKQSTAIKHPVSTAPIMMLLSPCENQLVKIWEHLECDVDADGTKYHRCLRMGRDLITNNPINFEPFKVRIQEYDLFIHAHICERHWRAV